MSMLHQLDQYAVELAEALRGRIPGTLQRANNELNGSAANNVELGASILRSKVQSAVSGKGKQVASGLRSSDRNGQGPHHTSAGEEKGQAQLFPLRQGELETSVIFSLVRSRIWIWMMGMLSRVRLLYLEETGQGSFQGSWGSTDTRYARNY